MAILVDDAIWPWRGRRWAHLVSDSHHDELHDFAHRLGVPYLAFQGDHYDIHAELRDQAVAAGARPVSGRQVVGALRSAGLRRRGGIEPWRWQWRVGLDRVALDDLPRRFAPHIVEAAHALGSTPSAVEVGVARRDGEALTVVTCHDAIEVEAGLVVLDHDVRLHRSSGERGTYLEWQLQVARGQEA